MSFSSIQIVPAADGFTVTIALPDGRTVSQLVDDASGVLPVAVGCWGVDGSGRAYFDSAGASPGEEAILGWDPTGIVGGSLYLETATDSRSNRFATRKTREAARLNVKLTESWPDTRKTREAARLDTKPVAAWSGTQKTRFEAMRHRRRYVLHELPRSEPGGEPSDPTAAREARWLASGCRRR